MPVACIALNAGFVTAAIERRLCLDGTLLEMLEPTEASPDLIRIVHG